jgi:N-acetylmuramoyl-L-alanine amidase
MASSWADPVSPSTSTPVAVSTPTPVRVSTNAWVTMVHPAEGAKLPPIKEVFVFGAVVPGSTCTINGSTVPVHPKGGYIAMVPLVPGDILLKLDAKTRSGDTAHLERRFSVSPGFVPLPPTPLTINKDSIIPADDMLLAPGDTVRVSFQGTPQAVAEFAVEGLARHVPMLETGNPPQGLYEGSYVIPLNGVAERADIVVTLKRKTLKKEHAKGHLSIESGGAPRIGIITEDTVAARTSAEGGYDVFLYKGMRVRLTGKIGNQWRVRFSATQSGWVKESAIQELTRGTLAPQSLLTNMTILYQGDSTIVRIPLSDVLPYRLEQSLDPLALTITLFGAANKTDLIRYDPADPLVHLVRWRQIAPDTCQVIIEPKFKKWWGFDVRYEGSTLLIEIRKPWAEDTLRDMAIAIDAGHGGSDNGALGPHGTFEKDANLAIAKVVVDTLQKSGAKPFLTRNSDMDVPLYDRARIAWKNKARLFVSVHCNSSGLGENPILNNGSSIYFYQPQSQALAEAVHAGYRKHVGMIPDHGLFYDDLAVCRMTQMPAILTEQAFIILPEQESLLFDPKFQKNIANAIVYGIKTFIKP